MKIKIIFIFLVAISLISLVSAWTFNGTIRAVNGSPVNNASINISYWTMGAGGPPSLIDSSSTYSNASGWFNISVTENVSYMYKPVVKHVNNVTNALDFIGQSLPQFPFQEFANTSNLDFYLRGAGTINITAVNRTGGRTTFRYQVKDTKLGYPIASEFSNAVLEAIVFVPRDRNYSVMVYAEQSIPVSFNWNNFTSNISYNITVNNLSMYNVTTYTVQKQFNCTDNLIWLSGYIQNSSLTYFANWSEFKVVPYLLEPGNMIYLGDNAGMPHNMSGWQTNSSGSRIYSDNYNATVGFYNITLPGPEESATYILFATARNASGYYGGYKNITLSYSALTDQSNFTMYPLMSTDWASSNSNITLNDAIDWSGKVNISSAKQVFTLINSSGSIISNTNFHLEVKVDYTNYGAKEFTFMTDISSGNAKVYLPLLNASVKEINIFSQSYAPKSVTTKTAFQILNNSNITMSAFNPGDANGVKDLSSTVYINMYKSNSTCDVPNPPAGCSLVDSANMDNFNPLSSIIGGGALSFRMGLTSSKIEVHYVNVDMMASGPPDALFDDSTTNSTTGGFSSAMKFGSSGPTIYDYVLISMPYTQGSTSQTGLNETADVNMSIPVLYDESWNVIWNATINGTNGGALAANYSHYNTYSSQWQTLMGQNNCTKNQSLLNSTTPCYVDITNDRIWIRIPHFSGTQPNVIGSVITATAAAATESPGSTSHGGAGIVSRWVKEIKINGSELNLGQTLKVLKKNYRAAFNISGMGHYVGVTNITSTTVTIEVASTPQTAILNIGDEKKFEVTGDGYYDLSVKLNSINSSNSASLTILAINEKIPAETVAAPQTAAASSGEGAEEETTESSLAWLWIMIAIIVILMASGIWYFINRKRGF